MRWPIVRPPPARYRPAAIAAIAAIAALPALIHTAAGSGKPLAAVARAGVASAGANANAPDGREARVVVIGAGIVGASAAYHLAERGARVTVVERERVGAAASGKAGGFLARNWGDGGPTQFLHRRGFDLHKELAARLNLSTWRPIPTLSVTREAWGEGRRDGSEAAWLGGQGSEATDIRLMDTDTAQVTPLEITEALMSEARRRDTEFIRDTVTGLVTVEDEDGNLIVKGVETQDQGVIEADKVVVAMGPWSTKVQEWLGIRTPMQGIYSSSFVFKAEANPEAGEAVRKEPRALFCSEDRFGSHLEVYPRSNGDVYVCGCGGSRYVSEEDLRNDTPAPGQEAPDMVRVGMATKSFKALAPKIANGRDPDVAQACMRPCPPDALPMIGRLPGCENAYIAAGHNCWGILWGPITGKLISELILDGEASLNLKAFDPARFGGRQAPSAGRRGRHQGSAAVGEQW